MKEIMPFEAQLAMEWWQASGERTEARLIELVRHYCRVYGRDAAYTESAICCATQKVRGDDDANAPSA